MFIITNISLYELPHSYSPSPSRSPNNLAALAPFNQVAGWVTDRGPPQPDGIQTLAPTELTNLYDGYLCSSVQVKKVYRPFYYSHQARTLIRLHSLPSQCEAKGRSCYNLDSRGNMPSHPQCRIKDALQFCFDCSSKMTYNLSNYFIKLMHRHRMIHHSTLVFQQIYSW